MAVFEKVQRNIRLLQWILRGSHYSSPEEPRKPRIDYMAVKHELLADIYKDAMLGIPDAVWIVSVLKKYYPEDRFKQADLFAALLELFDYYGVEDPVTGEVKVSLEDAEKVAQKYDVLEVFVRELAEQRRIKKPPKALR